METVFVREAQRGNNININHRELDYETVKEIRRAEENIR
jgi:hypothetical protein